ncbi:MAG: DUF4375 domain-containing protein [Deltaproteobacteria bacterium]|nr:MAG: DUF4375 domain-containing protein [Deltaproteobacteria bacterium]
MSIPRCELETGTPPIIEAAGQLADCILLSQRSVDDSDAYAVIQSNISVINVAQEGLLLPEELHPDALGSYYADYWIAQCRNGGFAQFIYNGGGGLTLCRLVFETLSAMGARAHLDVYTRALKVWTGMSPADKQRFFEHGIFGPDRPERDALNAINDELFDLGDREDLYALHREWLVSHPDARIVPIPEMKDVVQSWLDRIPDLANRQLAARLRRPEYAKLVDCLCAQAGLDFEFFTAGKPSPGGILWHFRASGATYYLEDDGDIAAIRPMDGGEPVARCRRP